MKESLSIKGKSVNYRCGEVFRRAIISQSLGLLAAIDSSLRPQHCGRAALGDSEK